MFVLIIERMDKRSRGWCFTVNNYTEDDIIYVSSLYENSDNCDYLIVGYEEGSRKKTPHLQCYIHYIEATSWKSMKTRLKDWHFEAQKSKSNVAAYCYCMEDDNYSEWGTRPRQGHRTDLEVIKHDLKNGKRYIDVADEYFSQWVYHRRAFSEYINMKIKYKTKLVLYDVENPKVYRQIYSREKIEESLILESEFAMTPNELWSRYYSGKYYAIYAPKTCYWDKFNDEIDEYIE